MTPTGWDLLVADTAPFQGDGRFPLPAYSEFMPGPFVGRRPYGEPEPSRDPSDSAGFHVTPFEEVLQLTPGLDGIARHLGHALRKLADGEHTLSKALLTDNPWWPERLAAAAAQGRFRGARLNVLVALSLSRTLDDKGRVRWTLFGSSEQGPARAFWQSFRRAPGEELPPAEGIALLDRFASDGESAKGDLGALRASGLRILSIGPDPDFSSWGEEPLPSWAGDLRHDENGSLEGVRRLVTFRPFARLPEAAQQAFLDGKLELLPFPGSLVFFGHPGYRKLSRTLAGAMQIPLLHLFPGAHAAPSGMRIPQSGWLVEHDAALGRRPAPHGPIVGSAPRTSRWDRSHRDENEITIDRFDKVGRVLFDTSPEALGLYGKPMARNAQIWTDDHRLLLDGPRCEGDLGRQRLDEAERALTAGGHFGYRFQFPPMRCGAFDLYWQVPLAAAIDEGGETKRLPDGPSGYLTASVRRDGPRALEAPVELWPRFARAGECATVAADLFRHEKRGRASNTTAYNIRKLIEAHEAHGGALPPSLARRLLTDSKDESLEQWFTALPGLAIDPERGQRLATEVRALVAEAAPASEETPSLTFQTTAHRTFEERYFRTIAELAEGRFIHKDNADFAGKRSDSSPANDLDALGDHLHHSYRELIARHRMSGSALVADHRLRWRTDFDFPWSGGWLRNQTAGACERNVMLVIPGRDRSRAVVMGDHYDTAYMEDLFRGDKELGRMKALDQRAASQGVRDGKNERHAASGADDNHSSTAALLMAADVLLPLSREGKLARDVWLVHLTGEEFPSDCLGARHLVQRLVEGNFAVEADGVGHVDLSHVRVEAAFVLDMIAHNNDHDRDHNRYIFQIAPGAGARAARLAYRAHRANERWNHEAATWNRHPDRRTPGPSVRMENGDAPPKAVAHPTMAGEIRPGWHPRSSLYNTDAQIFSDAGIPVVLFIENYDINRKGYHDSHDTMKNIDLDFGAALAAIAIETVVDAATAETL